MHLKFIPVGAAILSAASLAMGATVTAFEGADCTGSAGGPSNIPTGVCGTLGSSSAKSISYSGVPNEIQFFVSGGLHDNCSNGPQLVLGGGSGCATAPAGFNWESVFIS